MITKKEIQRIVSSYVDSPMLIEELWHSIKTAQPSKPLTDEQIKLIMDGRGEEGDDDYVKPAFDPFGISEDDLMNFVRAIEAAHQIGEQK